MNMKKLFLLNLPYLLFVYPFDKLAQAFRLAPGADLSGKLLSIGDGFKAVLSSPWLSFHPTDLLIGITGAVVLRMAVYLKGKNAKKYRHGIEYGSARWGTAADIAPYMDKDFFQNIPMTQTERITMASRPKQPKYARNKNILVIGGSGSGKTRFFCKPSLLQAHSSYVCTDPKGTLLPEIGTFLERKKYRIKCLNLINFRKSMKYNPLAYIRSEKDILKLVNALIMNTKGEGEKSSEDFWVKAERLYYSALIGYIWYEATEEEKNFITLLDLINASEAREDDETYQSPVNLLFSQLEEREPDHFAVKQYRKFKMAAGKTLKSILISCGARLAPFDIKELRDLMEYDELELDTLGDQKTALFVILSDTDSTFNFVAALMYSQLFNLLCDKADDFYGGRLPVHVRLILDEFANIGQIPNFDKLIATMKRLRDLGNTLIVVEHDEDIMRAADYIIDVGPDAGRLGGEIVFEGTLDDILHADPDKTRSHTVRYLSGADRIPVPQSRRQWNHAIKIKGARMNNLRGIDVTLPLNVLTVVTGVSGSGKSSLIKGILYPALKRHLNEVADAPGEYSSLEGDWQMVKHVEFVDQNPIGKSTRSNPATYIKAYDAIRQLFASQPLAKQEGYTAQYFSFNAEGGRCEECKGAGVITVEMQFMADLVLECDACHGRRFKKEILDVRYHDKNIYDVLNMTVREAIEFFEKYGEKQIADKLRPLDAVGLGYIKLGQSSSTLSGGENQRVKLAYFIGQERQEPTLFIFDEPTTGLHFHDIHRLLKAFNTLIEKGHSIIVIEHNMDVIKCGDYVIDLGPDGGNKGGNIVCCGTPEEVARCRESATGRYLSEKLRAD